MSRFPRFVTTLWVLAIPVLVLGLSARDWAQTTEQPPLLQVEGTLQGDDETLPDGRFYDVHEFTGQADQAVPFLLESDAFDPYLILEDEQGNRIATNDDISSDNTNAALLTVLPAPGRYRVIAKAFAAEGQGPYRLTVQSTPANAPNPLLSAAEVSLLEAQQLLQSGIEHFQRSDFRTALSLWEEALSRFRVEPLRTAFPQDSRLGEANALGNLGSAYNSLGDYERAIDFHQQSLAIARELGDRRGEANALGNLGSAYYSLGDSARAIDFHQQWLAIAREIGDRLGEAAALNTLGLAYNFLGDYERAIDFHQQSLAIAREIGDRRGESASLGTLGLAYYSLGDYARAIDFHQQSLAIAREIGDRRVESVALGNLGYAYNVLGDSERAIDFQQQSLAIAREIGNRLGESHSLGNLGLAYYSLGDSARAIDFYQQSLAIAREIGDRRGEANALGGLGNTYYSLGDYARAIDFHQQSIAINREIGHRSGEATSLGGLGNAYHALGDYERAIDFLQQTLAIAREIGDRSGEGASLHNLGAAFWSSAQLSEAAKSFESSALVQESLHSTGLADANRLSLLDSQQRTYRLWQMMLMAQRQPQAALAVAQRGRAQALASSMSQALTTEDNETWTPPTPPNLEQIQAIAVQQQATLVEYAVLPSGRILIWVIQPDGTLHSTESDAAALDDSLETTANLFATLGQNGRGGSPPETPLSDLVQATQAALTAGRGNPSDAPAQISRAQLDGYFQQLHEVLIEPIEQWLPTDERQRVIFIPHRELFRVPFAALQDDEGLYLIEKHTLLTAPSIQSLDLAHQHRRRIQTSNATDALIVGNPTLPTALTETYGWKPLSGAEAEASQVSASLSRYLGTEITALTRDQATETAVKQRLHTARFIHLATHGTLASGAVDSSPQANASGMEDNSQTQTAPRPTGLQYSTIPGVLALAATGEGDGGDDGALTADELLEMTISNPLNAELVVLSACQTGQGPITSDGVYGLSRTLLTAGVPTLVVSLWNASDKHTVELMDEFYRQFLEEDQDKAQALRLAMLRMLKDGDPNPQYWAPFTLVGDAQ